MIKRAGRMTQRASISFQSRPIYIYIHTEINTISHPYFLILGLQENVYLWQENKGDRNNSCLLIRILSERAKEREREAAPGRQNINLANSAEQRRSAHEQKELLKKD
jgi:hypothetical protein